MKKCSDLKINELRVNGEEFFAELLLQWNATDNNRHMPWKGEKDVYRIWLSEIFLQQTRVEQGLKYYQTFITKYPNIKALATAPEDEVYKLWEGLGYYSRCRNLIQVAKFIHENLDDVFPSTYADILALKGIGHYTAAAIASFAYNLPYAVLDGNVYRVLSRIFNDDTPIDSLAGKQKFSALAQMLLPPTQAGEYNQAIMDFGAVICKPVPVCHACFYQKHCAAFCSGQQLYLPVKEKRLLLKKRWLNYFILRFKNWILVQKRTETDIWQGLYQYLLIETSERKSIADLMGLLQFQLGISQLTVSHQSETQQTLTHQKLHFHFLHIPLSQKIELPGYQWVSLKKISELAFPVSLKNALNP